MKKLEGELKELLGKYLQKIEEKEPLEAIEKELEDKGAEILYQYKLIYQHRHGNFPSYVTVSSEFFYIFRKRIEEKLWALPSSSVQNGMTPPGFRVHGMLLIASPEIKELTFIGGRTDIYANIP